MIPTEPLSNFAFKNMGNLSFENSTKEFGLDVKSLIQYD